QLYHYPHIPFSSLSCSNYFSSSVISRPPLSDVEPVGLNLIYQRRPRNAELLRGPRAIPAMELERPFNVHPLHLRQRDRLVALTTVLPAGIGGEGGAFDTDLRRPAGQDH